MYGNPSDAGGSSTPTGEAGTRAQRYNYLQGRLRSRQITMEEATELFTVMQAMLARANELARMAALRAPSAPPTPSPSSAAPAFAPPPPPRAAPASGGTDDLLLVGLLAMGAGAGLLAALSKRIGDTSPPSPSGSGRSTPSSTSR